MFLNVLLWYFCYYMSVNQVPHKHELHTFNGGVLNGLISSPEVSTQIRC